MDGASNRFDVSLEFYYAHHWVEKHEATFWKLFKKISDRVGAEYKEWTSHQEELAASIDGLEKQLAAVRALGGTLDIPDLRRDLMTAVLPPNALMTRVSVWYEDLKKWYIDNAARPDNSPPEFFFSDSERPNYLRDSDRFVKDLRDFRLLVIQERRKNGDDFLQLVNRNTTLKLVLEQVSRLQEKLRSPQQVTFSVEQLPISDLSARYAALKVEHADLSTRHTTLTTEDTRKSLEIAHLNQQMTAMKTRLGVLTQVLSQKPISSELRSSIEPLRDGASIDEVLDWISENVGLISFQQGQTLRQSVRDFLSDIRKACVGGHVSSSAVRHSSGSEGTGSGRTADCLMEPVINQINYRLDQQASLTEYVWLLRNLPILEILQQLHGAVVGATTHNRTTNLAGGCYGVARSKGYFSAGRQNGIVWALEQFAQMFRDDSVAGKKPILLAEVLQQTLEEKLPVFARRLQQALND